MLLVHKMDRAINILRTSGVKALLNKMGIPSFSALMHWAKGSVKIDTVKIKVRNRNISREVLEELVSGVYEIHERILLCRHLSRDLPILELGACIGVIACLSDRTVSKGTEHIVVEANPNLKPILELHRRINNCSFTIVNAAIAYDSDTVPFNLYKNILGSSLMAKTNNTVQVRATTIQEIVSTFEGKRFNLICDIEGYELEMLRHELEVIRNYVECLIIEVHDWALGQDGVAEFGNLLSTVGFKLADVSGPVRCYINSAF